MIEILGDSHFSIVIASFIADGFTGAYVSSYNFRIPMCGTISEEIASPGWLPHGKSSSREG